MRFSVEPTVTKMTKTTKTTTAEQSAPASLAELRERAHQALLRAKAANSAFFELEQSRYHQDVSDTQSRADTPTLMACLSDWVARFQRLAAHPDARPVYIGWLAARHALENSQVYLSRMHAPQIAEFQRLRSARHDREAAVFLVDCENARVGMRPAGMVIGEAPNLIPEGRRLIQRIRQQGFSLSVDGEQIVVNPCGLSESQKQELSRLSSIVAVELGEVERIAIVER